MQCNISSDATYWDEMRCAMTHDWHIAPSISTQRRPKWSSHYKITLQDSSPLKLIMKFGTSRSLLDVTYACKCCIDPIEPDAKIKRREILGQEHLQRKINCSLQRIRWSAGDQGATCRGRREIPGHTAHWLPQPNPTPTHWSTLYMASENSILSLT